MLTTSDSPRAEAMAGFDARSIRRDFPIFAREVHGRPLVYLDSAATAQKPAVVLKAMTDYYTRLNANVHRGVHTLSQEASAAYDTVRAKATRFLGAPDSASVIFTHGTTSAVNLVARSYGDAVLTRGDEIIVTAMEHHSNFVPWQALARRAGAAFRVAPVDDTGALDLEGFAALLTDRTRIVAVAHVSNVLGTVNPIAEIARLSHARGAIVVVDGAQAAPHIPIDVAALDCDFYVVSGHKMFGPTGIGLLWGRRVLLEAMPPYEMGGGMIDTVSTETTTWAPLPSRFEAGTPPIAEVIGLGAAIDYLAGIPFGALHRYEGALLADATTRLVQIPGVQIVGTAPGKVSVLSFVLDGVHPHDIGTVLDAKGVAIRAGHHCAQPLMARYGLAATARASFALYNTEADVDALVAAVDEARRMFA